MTVAVAMGEEPFLCTTGATVGVLAEHLRRSRRADGRRDTYEGGADFAATVDVVHVRLALQTHLCRLCLHAQC